jgi:UrcA family protein
MHMFVLKVFCPPSCRRSCSHLALACVAALAVGLGAAPAVAGNLSDGEVHINVSDIDLSSGSGRLERDQRVVKVARPICEWINPKGGATTCVQRAIGDAARDCGTGGQQYCHLRLMVAGQAQPPALSEQMHQR